MSSQSLISAQYMYLILLAMHLHSLRQLIPPSFSNNLTSLQVWIFLNIHSQLVQPIHNTKITWQTPQRYLASLSKFSSDVFSNTFSYWITAYTILNLLLPQHIASSSTHVYQWLEAHKNIRSNHCHSYTNTSNCIHSCSDVLINPAELHLYCLVLHTKIYLYSLKCTHSIRFKDKPKHDWLKEF